MAGIVVLCYPGQSLPVESCGKTDNPVSVCGPGPDSAGPSGPESRDISHCRKVSWGGGPDAGAPAGRMAAAAVALVVWRASQLRQSADSGTAGKRGLIGARVVGAAGPQGKAGGLSCSAVPCRSRASILADRRACPVLAPSSLADNRAASLCRRAAAALFLACLCRWIFRWWRCLKRLPQLS